MKIADDRHAQAALFKTVDDVRNGCCRVFVVDCDANQLRASERERCDLFNGSLNVGCVGVGHRLDDDGNFPADSDVADADSWSFSALNLRHASILPPFGFSHQLSAWFTLRIWS